MKKKIFNHQHIQNLGLTLTFLWPLLRVFVVENVLIGYGGRFVGGLSGRISVLLFVAARRLRLLFGRDLGGGRLLRNRERHQPFFGLRFTQYRRLRDRPIASTVVDAARLVVRFVLVHGQTRRISLVNI